MDKLQHWAQHGMKKHLQSGGALVALALLVIFNLLFTESFLSLQTLNVNLTQVTTIVIVGVGMTLVIATGGIDLSVGALMAIAGTLAPLIFQAMPGPLGLLLGIVVPILVAAACGCFNGWLVTSFNIQPIVATLVLFIAGRGVAQVLTNGNLLAFANEGFAVLGKGKLLGIPVQVLLMLAIVLAASWVLRRTVFGRFIVATGANARAAHLSGIPAARIKVLVYALCGALAGLAGLITVSINASSDANQNGLGMELDAIAATAVGGTLLAGGRANIFGTLVGALIIQLMRYTLLAHGVTDAAAMLAKAAIIVVAVWVQKK
jgi:ribose/xylose/arabinose/galactoside ABC-type transport system permease subunit